ncbi:hypothetical protein PSN45_001586 [Yamadazyma tenuis]|uniref:FAD/NAD(P)-binding domain-containing protein n=1 Tax=Candida tenuis (strain ATCC 10573 / BCRC 21748 / CBS 615 / JCM 9827 / NBRC 10315 / NRRL Y-1498 / VKM Y-70) TaxID=590646 RepID=G3BF56_CANTC|nr:uncharacterized protein CANTEDRAFT_111948 [Yamadazyma tenuis ATCC 10573]EGV60642.1 hypothetical protein CANTEDRAFT_111948 [Yamadazyma tenuis ATCC 10573]WEJ94107.1 hypothetical protein PSN45_001586 [Yamadazyma tenuis]
MTTAVHPPQPVPSSTTTFAGFSDATILDKFTSQPVSFTTNILVVGGAYAGLSAINAFVTHFKAKSREFPGKYSDKNMVSITLIEPRAGLLNVIGMPRCIVDTEFAQTQFVSFDRLNNFKIDRVVSANDDVVSELAPSPAETSDNNLAGVNVNYVQGHVTYLDETKAQYTLVADTGASCGQAVVDFDYVILATGRDRNWPTTPKAYTHKSFLREMDDSMVRIDAANTISIVGGGAVGIELAGDLKHFRPHKTINLIHPHASIPPEPLQEEFKRLALDSLCQSGVNVILNTRIEAPKSVDLGTTSGDLSTTSGGTITSDLNIWCTAHRNNTSLLAGHLKQFVTPKNDILVNEYLQLKCEDHIISNFFVLGDLVSLDIIKSAGWACYHGRQVANNLTSLIFDNTFVEPTPALDQVPRGMVLVAGNGELICELGGEVSKNVPDFVEEYKDYCFGRLRATLDV